MRFGKSLSVLLDTTVGNEGSQGRSVSGVQFSLDPVVRMGRPADRKACLYSAMKGGEEFCLWMFGVLLGLVSRMQENSGIGRTPGTRARRRRMERSRLERSGLHFSVDHRLRSALQQRARLFICTGTYIGKNGCVPCACDSSSDHRPVRRRVRDQAGEGRKKEKAASARALLSFLRVAEGALFESSASLQHLLMALIKIR